MDKTLKVLNIAAFILFSIVFLPVLAFVYFMAPVWEKWTESAFTFKSSH